jgi:hypothetical protein
MENRLKRKPAGGARRFCFGLNQVRRLNVVAVAAAGFDAQCRRRGAREGVERVKTHPVPL